MSTTFRVKDTDKGMRRLFASLKVPKGIVRVGVHQAKGRASKQLRPPKREPKKQTSFQWLKKTVKKTIKNLRKPPANLIDVAYFHEFGTKTIKKRSFIRAWADKNEDRNRKKLRRIGAAIVKGKVPNVAIGLERFGAYAAADIQKRISRGIAPRLKKATIDAKGSSKQLVDTGQLRSAITFQVTK